MAKPDAASDKHHGGAPGEDDVAVVGGGIAGMTCALRLAQRGYQVTLYESAPMLGGNASSEPGSGGIFYDVYPHLYCDWYANFWKILEADLGMARQEFFEPRTAIKILDDPSGNWAAAQRQASGTATTTQPNYQELQTPTTPQAICYDLLAGVLPPPDMFLFGFALLDLAAQPFPRLDTLQRQTINGFLYSRGYTTEDCAKLHDTILMEIWSIPSSETSAAAYHAFVRHNLAFASGKPFAWLLRGSLQEMLIRRWQKKLTELGCRIKTRVEVTKVELDDNEPARLTLKDHNPQPQQRAARKKQSQQQEPVLNTRQHKNVVLAVPAPALARLVMAGQVGKRIVDKVQELSELRRLQTARILVANLFFKEKLPNIPPEHVGLAGSRGYLSFVDISQLWTSLKNGEDPPTVLVLAASDSYALSSENSEEWAHMMIEELARYLPAVKAGRHWGDRHSNIDYSKSLYQKKYWRPLFLNTIESDRYKPSACYPHLKNIFFAGDFCTNDIKMATIEAAVVSGLRAAEALRRSAPKGEEIAIIPQAALSRKELLALKLALLPAAYGAKAWSIINGGLQTLAERRAAEGVISSLAGLSMIPFSYAADWWGTVEAIGLHALSAEKEPEISASMIADGLSLASRSLLAAGSYLQQLITEQSAGQPAHSDGAPPTLLSLAKGLGKAIDDELRKHSPAPAPAPEAAAVPADLRWISALGQMLTKLQSAVDQGSRRPPGSGRYRAWSEQVRRHRVKL
jgi:uncharacterized protein with NAD-binding domain and iron-sulfur cluster